MATQPRRALDPVIIRNVRGSKEARQALRALSGLVEWIDVTEEDKVAAKACAVRAKAPWQPGDDLRGLELNKQRAEEYTRLFAAERLDPANLEVAPPMAAAVLRALRIQSTDRFLDLGSSHGTLVIAAATTTSCARCAGIELSPSSHAAALEVREQHLRRFPADARRVLLMQGDLREAPLDEYNVLYCAIKGHSSRPKVMDELLTRLMRTRPPDAKGWRLVCAGFGVDLSGRPYGSHVSLARAYAMSGTGSGADSALAMYGETEGPRVLLEYHVTPPRDMSPASVEARATLEIAGDHGKGAGSIMAHSSSATATASERWGDRCRMAGMGYLVAEQALMQRALPQPIAIGAGAGDGVTGRYDGSASSQCLGHPDDDAVGAAIDRYIERTRPLFDATFARAPRHACASCGRRKRWFCCHCLAWLPPVAAPTPLRLPLRVEILVRDDIDSATGIHAAALAAPVTIRHFPDGLWNDAAGSSEVDGAWVRFDPSRTFVLYPSRDAATVAELARSHRERLRCCADGPAATAGGNGAEIVLVVPDTKWNNDGAVLQHPSLRGLPHLRLRQPPSWSRIWRSNARAVEGCVSTIEAIYCLLSELETEMVASGGEGGGMDTVVEGGGGEAEGGGSGVGRRVDQGGGAAYDSLLLLFAMTRHLIELQTAEHTLAPYDEEKKCAERARRSQKQRS